MPRVSYFFGIAIYVYYREHQPPHFHAIYGDDEAVIAIDSPAMLSGHLPPRALGMVMEWANRYHEDLQRAWRQAVNQEAISAIPPLD